jgi:uncharacterized protein YpmB
MLNNKKRLIYIGIAAVTVIAITVGIVIFLNSSKPAAVNQKQNTIPAKSVIDADTMDAVKILTSDPVKAKSLLLIARDKYKALGDDNGVRNVDSQIYLIDHPIPKK